jgi:hypothetical protein
MARSEHNTVRIPVVRMYELVYASSMHQTEEDRAAAPECEITDVDLDMYQRGLDETQPLRAIED